MLSGMEVYNGQDKLKVRIPGLLAKNTATAAVSAPGIDRRLEWNTTLWNTRTKRPVQVQKSKMGIFLQNHADAVYHVPYNGQDGWTCSGLGNSLKRVAVWDTVRKHKISGSSAPPEIYLEQYLRANPGEI